MIYDYLRKPNKVKPEKESTSKRKIIVYDTASDLYNVWIKNIVINTKNFQMLTKMRLISNTSLEN